MTSEELKIKVKIDTSGVESGAAKVKSSLKGIEDAAGGAAGSTVETSGAMTELHASMKALMTLQFADLMNVNGDTIKKLKNDIKGAADEIKNATGNIKNAFEALNPNSKLYKNDVEWEGYDAAWDSFKINIDEVKTNIKNLGREATSAFGRIKHAVITTTKAVGLLSIALVPVAGIMSSFSASALGKEIYNTAQRVGMGTAAYQQWKYIIEQTGGDITDLIGAQQTLTEAQLDVAEGAEDMIAAFKRIGLSAEEVLAMDRQELFEKTIAGLQNIENSTERAAVGYRLLSEDASTLAALLGMSNEQTRQLADNYQYLGAIMSEELIGKSLQFQGALSNLRGAFQGITNTLAEIFLPVLTTVINAIAKAMAMVNMFIRTLFGLELTTSESGTSSVVGSGINGFGAMTDSIEEAEKEAQKLRRTLMGFDELNVLEGTAAVSTPAAGAGASASPELGGGMGNVGGGLFNPDNLNLDIWHERFNEWSNLIQTFVPIGMIGLGAIGAVWFALSGNWVMALAMASMAGIGIAAANSAGSWEKLREHIEKISFELPLVVLTGLAAVGALYCILTGNIIGAVALATMAGIGIATINAGDGWDGIVKNIKEKVSPVEGIIMGVITTVALFIMGGPIFKALKIGWGLISAFFTKFIAPKLSGTFIGKLIGGIPTVFSNMLGKSRTTIMNGWNHIAEYFKKNIATKFNASFWTTKFDTFRAAMATKLGEARLVVVNGWNAIKKYFSENVATKFNVSYWSGKFDVIRAGLATKLGEAKTAIQKAWENIKKYFKGNIAMSFTAGFWATKFGTIKDGAKQALNGVIDIVEKAVNAIISKLNTLSWSIPDWIPKVGGKKFGFNIKQVKIPRLAEGGIATASTLANIGENGREAVLPLDHNTEWMDALADKIASRSQGPTKLVLKVGEKELGWASIKGINQITRQTGELQLVL
jgi:hypothetical protein